MQNSQSIESTLQAFKTQPFAQWLGVDSAQAGDGWFEVTLPIKPEHTQHDGVVHGGVLATLADTCAAMAAHTQAEPNQQVLTIEFKINYLRPAKEGILRCRGQVLRRGRTVTIAESEVFATRAGAEILVAKALATVMLAPER